MRCVLLLLVLSTFVFCDDVHIHKVVEDLTGWSEEDAKTIDSLTEETTDSKTGQGDKLKYDERLKYQHNAIWQKTVKFRETAARVHNENRAAFNFMDSVLNNARLTRRGEMKEDDASKKVVEEWDKLAKDVKSYLMKNFPALQHFSHFAETSK